jgi:hypothetical protein
MVSPILCQSIGGGLGMPKYYLSLVSEIFQNLARWRGMMLLLATIAIGILYNLEIGHKILATWDGFNPAWALVPVGLGGVWAFLSLNYQRHESDQTTIAELRKELKLTSSH